jgi:hypothetical protein
MLQKVIPGQPLRVPAPDYNAFIDAALDYQRRQSGTRRPGDHATARDRGIILVQNDTGADLEQYDVVGLGQTTGGVWPTPDDNEAEFLAGGNCFSGQLPTVAHRGRFAIVLGAMAGTEGQHAIGPALLAGVVPAYVAVQDSGDWWADVNDGEHATLASGRSGAAQILYKSAGGTGLMWCLVRLGSTGLPDGNADYQVPVWDNTKKGYYAGPVRAM